MDPSRRSPCYDGCVDQVRICVDSGGDNAALRQRHGGISTSKRQSLKVLGF